MFWITIAFIYRNKIEFLVIYMLEVNFMNSCEVVAIVNATACAIAKCVPKENLPLVTSIFGQIASTLTLITVQEVASDAIKVPPDANPTDALIIDPSINNR